MRHECVELREMFRWDVVEATVDGTTEITEIVVVPTVQNVEFDELPKTLDQVEVWRIGRQKQ